jgi:CheY-like chemotaxis protein
MNEQILIVDDDQDAIDILQAVLEHGGYKVKAALSGKEALSYVDTNPPDLVVLDIMMPDMDGYEVCEKLKENPKTKNIPIIMLTARDMGDDVEKALNKKADWYVSKPYDNKYLVHKVEYFLKESKKKL